MSTKQLSLLLFLLFTAYIPFVAAGSVIGFKKGLKQRNTPVPRDAAVNPVTNAERLLAGMPLLPPVRRPNRLYNASTSNDLPATMTPFSDFLLLVSRSGSEVHFGFRSVRRL